MLGHSAHETLCAPSKSGVSVSPSPVELLHSCSTGLQSQMLSRFFLLMSDPQTVLEGYFYVGTPLCSLRGINIFWYEGCFKYGCLSPLSVYAGHYFLDRRCD